MGWSGEQYEPDSAFGASAEFLKFARRVARVPEQCARYGVGVPVLWPAGEKRLPDTGACKRCGAARRWELQVMAPLLAMVDEAREWHVAEGAAEESLLGYPSSWDWSTVAVATCTASCDGGDAGACYVYEKAFVGVE